MKTVPSATSAAMVAEIADVGLFDGRRDVEGSQLFPGRGDGMGADVEPAEAGETLVRKGYQVLAQAASELDHPLVTRAVRAEDRRQLRRPPGEVVRSRNTDRLELHQGAQPGVAVGGQPHRLRQRRRPLPASLLGMGEPALVVLNSRPGGRPRPAPAAQPGACLDDRLLAHGSVAGDGRQRRCARWHRDVVHPHDTSSSSAPRTCRITWATSASVSPSYRGRETIRCCASSHRGSATPSNRASCACWRWMAIG